MAPTDEEYPTEIHDYLLAFEKSVSSVDDMLRTMMSVSRSELLQKSAESSLLYDHILKILHFAVYLATQGINPKEHPVKQELERIRTYMNRVKEITDKKKAAKLDKGAASRFVRNALYEPKPPSKSTKKTPVPAKKKKTH
ncbi:hypothetical protein JD844_023517 [Phrynosoma platyrhinos]|uniref:Nuclear nucleic acid-binding protein C1D n=1 Tax=Phrynosoma platyrhinos TaxID=52577 RepID=A0ABQ7SWV2_PHRPL|nr:hypothetical protein JD844_023517 [Phrynosoma platyrhinos]